MPIEMDPLADALAELPQLLVVAAHMSRTSGGPGWKNRSTARVLDAIRGVARVVFNDSDLAAAARDGYARTRHQCDDPECVHLTCAAVRALVLFVECGGLEDTPDALHLFAQGGAFDMALAGVFYALAHDDGAPLRGQLPTLPASDTAEDYAMRVACMRTVAEEPFGHFYTRAWTTLGATARSARAARSAQAASRPVMHCLAADFARTELAGVCSVDDAWCDDAAPVLGVGADELSQYARTARAWLCAA